MHPHRDNCLVPSERRLEFLRMCQDIHVVQIASWLPSCPPPSEAAPRDVLLGDGLAQGDLCRKCKDDRGKPTVSFKDEAAVERAVDQVASVLDNCRLRPSCRGSKKQRPDASDIRSNVCWIGYRRGGP